MGGHVYRESGALENILEAGYDGIKGEWNFPTGQAEEINNRTNK